MSAAAGFASCVNIIVDTKSVYRGFEFVDLKTILSVYRITARYASNILVNSILLILVYCTNIGLSC